jgi:hypothetical protein
MGIALKDLLWQNISVTHLTQPIVQWKRKRTLIKEHKLRDREEGSPVISLTSEILFDQL